MQFNETETRALLAQGAKIRSYGWQWVIPGIRVMFKGVEIGFISLGLFYQLINDGTLTKTQSTTKYNEYGV